MRFASEALYLYLSMRWLAGRLIDPAEPLYGKDWCIQEVTGLDIFFFQWILSEGSRAKPQQVKTSRTDGVFSG